VTLATTCLDLYGEYAAGVAAIRERLSDVEITHAPPLNDELSSRNRWAVERHLQAITKLPDIRYAEIRTTAAEPTNPLRLSVGERSAAPTEWRDIPLSGAVLRVEATRANLHERLGRRALAILSIQVLKTCLITLFILVIVHRLVTGRVLALTGVAAGFMPDRFPDLLPEKPRADELDGLADAFDTVGRRLEHQTAEAAAAITRMAAILDNIPDLAWVKDSEGRFIAVNRPLAVIYGLSDPAQMLGKTDFDFTSATIAAAYRYDDIEVMTSGRRKRIEESVVRACGRSLRVETIKSPLRDGGGAIVGTVGIARDIGERSAAQEALRQTTQRLQALIANVNATVFSATYSIDGPRLTFQSYGDSTATGETAAGDTPTSLETLKKAIHPDDLRWEFEQAGRSLHEKNHIERTVRMVTGNGETRWLLVRERVIDRVRATLVTEGLAIDISDQVTANRLLDGIVRHLPGAVFRYHYPADGDKRLLFLDGSVPRQHPVDLGSSPEDFLSIFPPEDRDLLFSEVPRRLRTEDEIDFSHRVIMADGSIRWFRVWERVVERCGDEFFTEGLTLDITEEMIAKQALEDNERRYRDLVETTNAVAWEYDIASHRFTYVSPQGPVMSGYSMEEWCQPGFWAAHIHPDDQEEAVNFCMSATARGEDHDFEYRLVLADGRIIWVGDYVHLHAEPGRPPSLRGLMIDITERKTHEFALKRINRVLRTIGAAKEVLVVCQQESELLRRTCEVIVEVGGYSMAWIGFAEDDREQTIHLAAHAEHEDAYIRQAGINWAKGSPIGSGPVETAIRTARPQVVDDIASCPAMAPFHPYTLERECRSAVALPIKGPTGVLGCLTIYAAERQAFSTDETISLFVELADTLAFGISTIRERHLREEMEQQLNQTRKMEALGQLAGSVAHDFNNLLGAILGFAGFIIEDTDKADPTYFHATRIVAAGKRGKTQISQILSFARPSELKVEAFRVADMVNEIGTLLAASIPASTRLKIALSGEAIAALGDRGQLGHALLNLCINAHDALEGQPGEIRIEAGPTLAEGPGFARLARRADTQQTGTAEIWTDAEGTARAVMGNFTADCPHVSLRVVDFGCGMDEPLLTQVFAPFFTTKEKGHGTGLGLAMVESTIRAHGGALLVESRQHLGTAFEIVLPAAEAPPAPPAPVRASGSPQPSAHGRVLLVDDDPDFSAMMLSALERQGNEVTPYADPSQALADFRQHAHSWDVVVTDQTMPVMTGLELIRQIRTIRADLPCILCTGFTLEQFSEDTLKKAGVLVVLRKPIALAELERTVSTAIHGRRSPAS
jgi:PAS domain S-box-containing protein